MQEVILQQLGHTVKLLRHTEPAQHTTTHNTHKVSTSQLLTTPPSHRSKPQCSSGWQMQMQRSWQGVQKVLTFCRGVLWLSCSFQKPLPEILLLPCLPPCHLSPVEVGVYEELLLRCVPC
jgi:hypothetical protein